MAGITGPRRGSRNHGVSPGFERWPSAADPEPLRLVDRLRHTGKENLFFDVILHLGTTAAILVYHRKSIVQGWRGLWALTMSRPAFAAPEVVRVGLLAAVATSPLVPFALFFKKMLEKTFEGTTVAGFGFLVTAAVLLITAWLGRRDGAKGPAETTLARRLVIGIAQMLPPCRASAAAG